MFVEVRGELTDLQRRFPVLLTVGVVLSIAVIALLAWLVILQVQPGDGSTAEAKPVALGGGPTAVSEPQLSQLSQRKFNNPSTGRGRGPIPS